MRWTLTEGGLGARKVLLVLDHIAAGSQVLGV
jgi:hypothetical protein